MTENFHFNYNIKILANGLPERIQISEAYKEALQKHYPEFRVQPRGKVELKASFENFVDINFVTG